MRILKRFTLLYPQQALLALLHSGLFVWIRLSMSRVMAQVGAADAYQQYVPNWLKNLTGNSLERFRHFLETSSWAWLVAALILILIWRLVSKVLRFILLLVIISGAFWLAWQNQEILSRF